MSEVEVNRKIKFNYQTFPSQCGAKMFYCIRSRGKTNDTFYQGYNPKHCHCPVKKATLKTAYGAIAREMMKISLRPYESPDRNGRHIIFSDRSDYNRDGAISWIGLAKWLKLRATTVSINPGSGKEIKTFVITHKKFNELYKKAMKQ